MKEYLSLCKKILECGTFKEDRTGTGTISYFGLQSRYDLQEGFPLLTTKKVHLKSIIIELLWFINGDTNLKFLVDNNVKIWNEWPFQTFKKSKDYDGSTIYEYIEKIKNNPEFAKKHGDLGPVYGKQWRNFGGVDQLKNLIEDIKTNPNSRRLIISSWNPPEISSMALPPCHAFIQFYVSGNKLSCQLYQRSADIFLGVPFNIASYSLLTMMIANVLNLIPGEFIHTIGDGHIYSNHIEQIKLQISRKPKKLPKMIINKNVKDIFSYKISDFELVGYSHHPAIKGKVSV